MHSQPDVKRLLRAALVVGMTLAVTACDEANDSNPSPFVDESGAPLYDEAVDPGEQNEDEETP